MYKAYFFRARAFLLQKILPKRQKASALAERFFFEQAWCSKDSHKHDQTSKDHRDRKPNKEGAIVFWQAVCFCQPVCALGKKDSRQQREKTIPLHTESEHVGIPGCLWEPLGISWSRCKFSGTLCETLGFSGSLLGSVWEVSGLLLGDYAVHGAPRKRSTEGKTQNIPLCNKKQPNFQQQIRFDLGFSAVS